MGAVCGSGSTERHDGNDIYDIPENRFDECGIIEEFEERIHN